MRYPAPACPTRVVGVRSVGTVRTWHREQGWGVIDSADTPGGCWVHFSHLWNDGIPSAGPGEVVEVTGGLREVFEGETVDFDWETPGQEGYDFRAVNARPRGRSGPPQVIRHYSAGEYPSFSVSEIQLDPGA
jgi:cold shock protein